MWILDTDHLSLFQNSHPLVTQRIRQYQRKKIWIQRDGTEMGIANELIAAGVSKEDIVLGFHAPYKRQFTDFAVG